MGFFSASGVKRTVFCGFMVCLVKTVGLEGESETGGVAGGVKSGYTVGFEADEGDLAMVEKGEVEEWYKA